MERSAPSAGPWTRARWEQQGDTNKSNNNSNNNSNSNSSNNS